MHNHKPPPVHITDFKLLVNGRQLAARRIDPAGRDTHARPVLVFLHEGLGSMHLWGDFPATIVAACEMPALLYDRLGHGMSDPLPSGAPDIGYLDREAFAFLPQVLAACAVRQSILIGHSDGGTIALLYAAQHPNEVLGIVTEASHVFVEDITREGIRQAVAAYRETGLKARLARYHGDKIDSLFWRWADTWLSDDFAAWNIEAELAGIQCPVLAIQGDADEYGTAAQMTAIAAHVKARSETFLVPGCAHMPHSQARKAVTERMNAFIRRLASAGSPRNGAQ